MADVRTGHGPPPLARGERRAGDHNGALWLDHPRSRGENVMLKVAAVVAVGPPPLARGEPLDRQFGRVQARTTPARAGRTAALIVGAGA